DPESTREIQNCWVKNPDNRLVIDCILTNDRKWGRKAINKPLVLKTWRKVLENEDSLPKDWTREVGVLVGI
ncbi:hypothetical protein B0H17DRAFT_902639, partial [Mycena rosella]